MSQHLRDQWRQITAQKTASSPRFWHGSPSGDLRGGAYGLHVGSREAARQALEARIGQRADGKDWDGTQQYGKTLLMGKSRIPGSSHYPYVVGYSMSAPSEDHYPTGDARYGDGTSVAMSAKPDLFEVEVVGEMGNTPNDPRTDTGANSNMKRQVSRGQAVKGYYYTNTGEDDGSLSAVVPGPNHVRRTGRRTAQKTAYIYARTSAYDASTFMRPVISVHGTWLHFNDTAGPMNPRRGFARDKYYGDGLYLSSDINRFGAIEHIFTVSANRVAQFPKMGGSVDDVAPYLLRHVAPEEVIKRNFARVSDEDEWNITPRFWAAFEAVLDEMGIQAATIGNNWLVVRDMSCLREITPQAVKAAQVSRRGIRI